MSETSQTPRPWKWQLFGQKWCLTGQHGMRPIVLAVIKGNPTSLVNGLLVPLDPNHPDAKLIESAPDLLVENDQLKKQRDALLEACEGLLSNGAWPVGESDRDRYYEFCEKANAAIAMARKGEK